MGRGAKFAAAAGLALCSAAALSAALTAPGRAAKRQRTPFRGRNFAHRGLHTPDRAVPENSLTAFRLAAEAGYGIELDVRLTRDRQVVVFHDDSLLRLCGVDARVDELTFAELRELRLGGTEEKIPLFSEVLETVDGRVPLIVELKVGERDRRLCEKTYALLLKYRGDACVESFSPQIVAWFRFHAPELLRGQLVTTPEEYRAEGLSGLQGFILSNTLLNFLGRPQFLASNIAKRRAPGARLCELLGAMKVGWTAHDASAERGRDAVIFEFFLPKIRYRELDD